MKEILKEMGYGPSEWQAGALIALMLALIGHVAVSWLFKARGSGWHGIFAESARLPAKALVWGLGLYAVYDLVSQNRGLHIKSLEAGFGVFFIVVPGWVAFNLATHSHKRFPGSKSYVVSKLLQAAAVLVCALLSLQAVGFSVGGVLAFGGLGGLVAGLAAKDLLANFFGALSIYLDQPFAIGDALALPEKNIQGSVESIGWRQTAIRTADNTLVIVPNALFSSVMVENISRITNRRINEILSLRHEDAPLIPELTDAVRYYLSTHPKIDSAQSVMVSLKSFTPYSADIAIIAHTTCREMKDFTELKQEILVEAAAMAAKAGARLAFKAA